MANDIADLLLRIDATTEGLRRELKRAEDAVTDSGKQIGDNTKKIDDNFSKMSDGVSKSLRLVGTALAAMGVSLSVKAVNDYADAWQNSTNQLKTVQKETESLSVTQDRLMSIANESRASFEATAGLYTRLTRSTESLNLTQAELIDLTETINKSFVVSGATANEANNAIVQLAQGLAAGALRGDEFNSVAEQSPILMQAIADSLNMTRGELRAFAAEGGITAEIVVNALKKASGEIDRTFSKMSATFEQNMTIARNNMLEFVGSSETVQRVSSATGRSIVALSENMDTMGNIAISAGVGVGALGAVHLVRFVAAMQSATAAQTAFNLVAAVNPYVLLAAGVGALTFAVLEYESAQKKANAATQEFIRRSTDFTYIADQMTAAQRRVTNATEDESKAIDEATDYVNGLYSSLGIVVDKTTAATNETVRFTRVIDTAGMAAYLTSNNVGGLAGAVEQMTYVTQGFVGPMQKATYVTEGFVGPIQQVTQATKDSATSTDEWARRNEEAARTAADAWGRTHDFLSDTFVDIFNQGGNAFQRIGDMAVATAQRIIAEWLAMKAMNLFNIPTPAGVSTNILGSVAQSTAGRVIGSVISGGASTSAAIAAGGQLGGVGATVAGGTGAAGVGAAAAGGGGLISTIGGAASAIGSAASAAGSAVMSGLAAIPGWGWALGGAALLAKTLDDSGTMSSNAGMLIRQVGNGENQFDVPAFASGFDPVGFARREDQGAATAIIDTFRGYDAALTSIAKSVGLDVNYNSNNFGGFNEKGTGAGLFFGSAAEDGTNTATPIEKQVDQFVSQWIKGLGGQVDQSLINDVLSQGSADAMLKRAAEIAGVDGVHEDGLDYVPFDGYRAELHRGERVLTASENREMSAMSGKMDALMMQVALYSRRMSQIIDDWDSRGLPPERMA